jgi:hypothetical protein
MVPCSSHILVQRKVRSKTVMHSVFLTRYYIYRHNLSESGQNPTLYELNDIIIANDQVIVSDSQTSLQQHLNNIHNILRSMALSQHIKTETMSVGRLMETSYNTMGGKPVTHCQHIRRR